MTDEPISGEPISGEVSETAITGTGKNGTGKNGTGRSTGGLVSVAEARHFVISSCRRLAPVRVAVADALGLVLAEPVRSTEAVPPFTNSSMDGFALRARDVVEVPARLKVVGALMAGDDPGTLAVGVGETVRIMTGAALPGGADAVCMVEHTRDQDGWAFIDEAVRSGANVRLRGDDIAPGAEVFAAGVAVRPAHIGVLASIGVEDVSVYPRPVVGVVSTGDELTSGPGPLAPGKIRDSNGPSLLAQLCVDGFSGLDLGQAVDEPDVMAALVQDALGRCDAVLTTGGVSVGDRDFVKGVLEKLGGQRSRWMQVAVRPGKPFAFSTLPPNGAPVFGLPGNPVSALVSYQLFARTALRFMSGHDTLERPHLRATAEADLARSPDGRLHVVRVHARTGADGELVVRSSGGQSSHQLRALAAANALAFVPDGEGVRAGESVEVVLLDLDDLGSSGS